MSGENGGTKRGPMHFSPPGDDKKSGRGDNKHAAPGRAPRALPAQEAKVTEPVFDDDSLAPPAPAQQMPAAERWLKPLRWPARLLGWAIMLLASLMLALAIDSLLRAAFARAGWLGWLAAGVVALAGIAALALALREIIGWWRLKRITRLRRQAEAALAEPSEETIMALRRALTRLYRRRADMRWAFQRLAEHDEAVLSPAERLRLLELEVLAPLDMQARRIILRAARDVAGLTALVPAAALDVIIVALINLRMLRRLAALYGGRPGFLGGVKLARMVLAHLAISGALALTDAFLPHVLGKGLAGRLSARFGEGVVNGVLSARIGLTALEFVRPLPFSAAQKPGLKDIVSAMLRGPGDQPAETERT